MITPDTPEFQTYFAGCKAIYAKTWPNRRAAADSAWGVTTGPKYIKVLHDGATHSFVMRAGNEGGDVFKPASFAAPAKHARGNIFDDHNGLRSMGPYYGPAYLR